MILLGDFFHGASGYGGSENQFIICAYEMVIQDEIQLGGGGEEKGKITQIKDPDS